jgi:hypothetical protein
MQLLSMWTFGLVTLATIAFFGISYPVARKLRTFWAWATGTEPPKEKMVVFLPLNLIIGLLAGGFLQTFYTVGSACNEAHQPVVVCTMQTMNQHPN